MKKLTIIAHIMAAEDKIDLVKTELLKLVEPTRAEEGCLQYDLHQDNKNLAHFFFFENWETRDLWQQHMQNKHIAEYIKTIEAAVVSFDVNEMTKIA